MIVNLDNFFIRTADIKKSLGVTQYRAKKIFEEYQEKLFSEDGVLHSRGYLPKGWFVEEYATDRKLSEQERIMMLKAFDVQETKS